MAEGSSSHAPVTTPRPSALTTPRLRAPSPSPACPRGLSVLLAIRFERAGKASRSRNHFGFLHASAFACRVAVLATYALWPCSEVILSRIVLISRTVLVPTL